ncbi:MAG: GFA family protein [Burkholderiales bacterium]|nr:GFA family protein [Burkholderiales bacterium]
MLSWLPGRQRRSRAQGADGAVALITHTGGCHCGRVRFEVVAPAKLEVLECNCSICSKAGYLHLVVPAERFRLLSGDEVLASYTFNTHTAKHLFCSICGVKSFYVPRADPWSRSVNARCLDPGTVEGMSISPFNGRRWGR